jgi:hypothetical protein
MSTPPTPMDLLRLYIDDVMPTDGTDPMFSDAELQLTLDNANQDPERAAVEGWRWKAAKYSSLVDVTEGNASRAMSDLQEHALAMVQHFEHSTAGPTEGRTRIGTIRRRGF